VKTNNFRLLLQDEFEARCKRNPQYSLRSFARAISIQSGALSEIMRGKRKITKSTIKKIGNNLKLTETQIENYIEQNRIQDSIDKSSRRVEDAELSATTYDQMNVDEFHYLTDIIYTLILEISKLKEFNGSLQFIVDKTGFEQLRIENAIERLLRMDYLRIHKNNTWEDRREFVMLNIGKSKEAQKAFQIWINESLKLAAQANNKNVPNERVFNLTHTLPIYSEDLDDLKNVFKKSTNLVDKRAAESKQNYDEVYEYHVCLYPLTLKP